MVSNYSVAKELADTLEYYQKRYLITDDNNILICIPDCWNELYFKIRICMPNSHIEVNNIIYTKELIKLIEENIKEGYKLLKIYNYVYLYDNTVEDRVPPIMKVMSTPLTIAILKNRK